MKSTIRKTICMLLGIAVVFSLSACGKGGGSSTASKTSQTASIHKDVLTLGVGAEPNTYDPYCATSTSGDTIFDFIYDRLVYTDYNGKFTPRLAEKWDQSSDGKVITFHLNPKAKWQDGQPFTAQDMVFSAQVATNKSATVTRRSYFASLEGTDDTGVCADQSKLGVVAVDEHTVAYHFKNPIAVSTFLYIDAQRYYPMPYHLLKDIPVAQLDKSDYWQHPIGTGAFKFESKTSGESITVVANKDYFLGAPNVDKITFKVMSSANFAAALKSGGLDGTLSDVPLSDLELLQSTKGLVAKSRPSYLYTYMSMNCQKDYFKDVRIRQAFNMAINRKTIVNQALYGHGSIAVSPLNSDNPYFDKDIAADPYNPTQAKKLLQEGGWDFNREITFLSYNTNPAREAATTIIQQNLKAVGVKVNIQMVDWSTLISMTRDGKTDLSILGGAGSLDPDDSRVLMQPGGAQNFCKITDSRYYELAQKGHDAITQKEKESIYKSYQKLMHDEPTYIWLYHNDAAPVYKDTIHNIPADDFVNLNYKAYAWTFSK